MAAIANGPSGGQIAKEICDALGLKHVRDLKIHLSQGSLFTATAEMYLDDEGAKKLPAILKKFVLTPILENTTTLGQDIETFDECVLCGNATQDMLDKVHNYKTNY
jgi:hypothetical protein